MLDIKKLLGKILKWISSYKPQWTYVSDVGNTIFNGTWTAPEDGMIVALCSCSNSSTSNSAYWYIKDNTANFNVTTMFFVNGSTVWRSGSFPVIKGHVYSTSAAARIRSVNAHYYKFT